MAGECAEIGDDAGLMPPLGDILFKLGSGEELSPGELNDLRLGVNRMQG